jgi:hypothetical protein
MLGRPIGAAPKRSSRSNINPDRSGGVKHRSGGLPTRCVEQTHEPGRSEIAAITGPRDAAIVTHDPPIARCSVRAVAAYLTGASQRGFAGLLLALSVGGSALLLPLTGTSDVILFLDWMSTLRQDGLHEGYARIGMDIRRLAQRSCLRSPAPLTGPVSRTSPRSKPPSSPVAGRVLLGSSLFAVSCLVKWQPLILAPFVFLFLFQISDFASLRAAVLSRTFVRIAALCAGFLGALVASLVSSRCVLSTGPRTASSLAEMR